MFIFAIMSFQRTSVCQNMCVSHVRQKLMKSLQHKNEEDNLYKKGNCVFQNGEENQIPKFNLKNRKNPNLRH